MHIWLQLLVGLYGIGFLVSIWAVVRSPEGFEDDQGFHLGRREE